MINENKKKKSNKLQEMFSQDFLKQNKYKKIKGKIYGFDADKGTKTFSSGVLDIKCEKINIYEHKKNGKILVCFHNIDSIVDNCYSKNTHKIKHNVTISLSKEELEKEYSKDLNKAIFEKFKQINKIFCGLLNGASSEIAEKIGFKNNDGGTPDLYDFSSPNIFIDDKTIYQKVDDKVFYKICDLDKLNEKDKKIYLLKNKKFNYKLKDFLDKKKIADAKKGINTVKLKFKKKLLESGKLKIKYNINDFLDDEKIVNTINEFYKNKKEKLTVEKEKDELYWDYLKRAINRANESSEFIKINLSDQKEVEFSSEMDIRFAARIEDKYVNVEKLIGNNKKKKNKKKKGNKYLGNNHLPTIKESKLEYSSSNKEIDNNESINNNINKEKINKKNN